MEVDLNKDTTNAGHICKPGLAKRIRLECARTQYALRRQQHQLQQLFWECTLRCNLHCLHCGSDCRAVPETQDMPLPDFLSVLDDISAVMNPYDLLVVTTGGEPLVRQDICECGRSIRNRGFHWGMVSNGWFLDQQMCDRLVDAGLETIAISLDGFANSHDWMRGHSGCFSRAERAIKTLVGKQLTWDVITCVNQHNIDNLSDFKDYLIALGVKQWRIFTIIPMGRAKEQEELQISKQQFCQLMDFIASVREEGKILLNYGCEGFLGNYELKVRDYPFFCQAGINVASILADGSISGCLSIRSQYHQGNIYYDRFMNIWANRFQAFRDREWMHTKECAKCDMWSYCQGNGMHLRDDKGNLMRCYYEI